jgi:hypothetical protein
MASFLTKFIAGAAQQGGVLLADKARAEQRAELEAKRDAVLDANRRRDVADERQYQTTRDTTKREQSLEDVAAEREFQREQGKSAAASRIEAARIMAAKDAARREQKIEDDKAAREFRQGESKLDRENRLQTAGKRTVSGSKDVMSTSQAISSVNSVHKALIEEQENAMVMTEDRKSAKELYAEAYDTVAERLGAGKAPKPGTVRRADLKPGERVAVSNDGTKRMVNRGGKWLTVID